MPEMIDKSEALELSGYVKSLSARLINVEKVAQEASSNIKNETRILELKKSSFQDQLKEVKDDLLLLKNQVSQMQKAIMFIIANLKSTLKYEDFERFRKRIDIWAPESFVTRNELEEAMK